MVGLWRLSILLYRRGHRRLAKLVKAVNFALCHTLLPYEAEVGDAVRLGHHGLGVVIHPSTTLGDRVTVWQNVSIAAEFPRRSHHRIVIGDDVVIGAGAAIVARKDRDLRIGNGAKVGANAVVIGDVGDGAVVVGSPADDVHPPNG